jgi:uncharacterized protein (DUF302 family)
MRRELSEMSVVKVTSRTITAEHITISSSLTFAEARRKLEEGTPKLDLNIVDYLGRGDEEKVRSYEQAGPALSIFLDRDHGALLKIYAQHSNAIQYEIGNPLTASKMTRHCLAAALYAPLRVVLYENEEGEAVFEYDKPSSLFGQFGDDRVTDVGRSLDAALEAALKQAAS